MAKGCLELLAESRAEMPWLNIAFMEYKNAIENLQATNHETTRQWQETEELMAEGSRHQAGDTRNGAAGTIGVENEVQIVKLAWLSNKSAPKTYGSMVVHPTRCLGAKTLLVEGFFHAGSESGNSNRLDQLWGGDNASLVR